jgi:hypothetical protein
LLVQPLQRAGVPRFEQLCHRAGAGGQGEGLAAESPCQHSRQGAASGFSITAGGRSIIIQP